MADLKAGWSAGSLLQTREDCKAAGVRYPPQKIIYKFTLADFSGSEMGGEGCRKTPVEPKYVQRKHPDTDGCLGNANEES